MRSSSSGEAYMGFPKLMSFITGARDRGHRQREKVQKRVPDTAVSLRVAERGRFEVRGCLRFVRVLARVPWGRGGRMKCLPTGYLRADPPMSTSFTHVVSSTSGLRFDIAFLLVTA